jgi:L-proline 3-hydroxylase, C-terminal/Aspartyl/Asparaginyl beta-hydroxylase
MHAYSIGSILSRVIDAAAADALSLEPHGYTSAYVEYSAGGWATAPLWVNPGDQPGEEVHEHEEPARPIASVRELHGINDLVYSYFDVSRLRSVRLFRASNGAIILPHRDYLEHKYGFTRIHVPLITNVAEARNTEDNWCFHMRRGEVWYLEARRVHSGGVTGSALRVHLVLDFSHATKPAETVVRSLEPTRDALIIDRPELPPNLIPSYQALAPFINAAVWQDLFHILARVHLRYNVGAADVYDWLEKIAAASGEDRDFLLQDVDRMKRYYISEGPTATATFDSVWSGGLERNPAL